MPFWRKKKRSEEQEQEPEESFRMNFDGLEDSSSLCAPEETDADGQEDGGALEMQDHTTQASDEVLKAFSGDAQDQAEAVTGTAAAEEEARTTEPDSGADFQEGGAQTRSDTSPSPDDKPEKPKKPGFFARLFRGMTKSRNSIGEGIERAFTSYEKIDEDFYEDLEETMIMGDIGIRATDEIMEKLRAQVKEQKIKDPGLCKGLLIHNIREQMTVDEHAYDFEKGPSVVLVIGVNGVGKTTSVGKLAGIYHDEGKKVIIAAADTFRAAAGEQLAEWAHRAGVEMIGAPEGADPASVLFDAVQAAKARKADILLVDTAGRLHNKKNLMAELGKIDRIISREWPESMRENLLVLDGTTGQNALSQAREFNEVTHLTGIILTKMDGTSKGGIAIAVQSELGIPVKFIGIGEKMDDLQKFRADDYVDALFGVERQGEEADS